MDKNPPPERPIGTKLVDSLFGDAPFNLCTSDQGLALKYLAGINEALDRHRESVERSLSSTALVPVTRSSRVPEYLPSPEIIVDTSAIVDAQREGSSMVADKLEDVIEAQRSLVEIADSHTPLYQRMIRNQGVSHALMHQGNQIATESAIAAFQQRNVQIRQLSDLIMTGEGIARAVEDVGMTVEHEAEATRCLLQQLFSDIGEQITDLTNEQVITRISILQALYQIRSTFLQTHEQAMLSHQQQHGLLQQILEAVRMTEGQKESRHQWDRAEAARARATSQEDFGHVLQILRNARELDDINPNVFLSVGTIQSTLGHPDLAALAFSEADFLIQRSTPHVSSYTLMNLANNLLLLGRAEHAERVMRKATKLDPHNREAWFLYGKTAWAAGKRDEAVATMKVLLKLNPAYYKGQILVGSTLREMQSLLFSHS